MIDTTRIDFKQIRPELFDSVAEKAAEDVAGNKDDKDKSKTNKSTQIRKFYDELCMWHEKIVAAPEKFDEHLPFIKMLNAKVAYANDRKSGGAPLVDNDFVALMKRCLSQVHDIKSLNTCKTFMEAFMGFYKGLKG